MRAHHVIAIVAVILVGVGMKLTFFAAPTAEADPLSFKSVSLDISQMHQNTKNLPVQKLHSSFPTVIDLTPFRNASFDIP